MKKLVTSYTFDASAKTITAADFTSLEAIQLITNVTDNVIIYNFADPSKGGSLSGTTLTLDYDTTSMDDADKLQIFVDAGTTQEVSGTVSVTGVATAANQSTANTALSAIQTAVQTLDNAISGNEMQVDVVAALPAGTNNIGDVDAIQSGIWGVRPDSYATDDTAMPATPLVLPVAGEYRATPTTYTDGDATVLQSDVNGNLKVSLATGLTTTDEISTQPNSYAVDDSAMPATPKVTPVAGEYRSTPTTYADGDATVLQTDVNGNLKVATHNVTAAGDVASGSADSGNPVKVGGKYNSTNPSLSDGQRGDLQLGSRGSLRVELFGPSTGVALGAVADNADAVATSASANKLAVLARNTVFNGTSWDRQYGDTTGTYVAGAVASGATDSGNPVKVGGKYNATLPTLSDGQRGDLQVGSRGVLRVALVADGATTIMTRTSDNSDAMAVSATSDKYVTISRNNVFNGTTWDRTPGDTTGAYSVSRASTVGGYTPGQLISAATTNATNVKASAAKIGYITASNVNAAARYLKIYNKATSPTVGTDTPVHTFLIPGNTAGAGTNIPLPSQGIELTNGFSFALTTGAAVSDTGAVAASELIVNYGYK